MLQQFIGAIKIIKYYEQLAEQFDSHHSCILVSRLQRKKSMICASVVCVNIYRQLHLEFIIMFYHRVAHNSDFRLYALRTSRDRSNVIINACNSILSFVLFQTERKKSSCIAFEINFHFSQTKPRK